MSETSLDSKSKVIQLIFGIGQCKARLESWMYNIWESYRVEHSEIGLLDMETGHIGGFGSLLEPF